MTPHRSIGLILPIALAATLHPGVSQGQEDENYSVSAAQTPLASANEVRYLESVLAHMNGVEGSYPSNITLGCAAVQTCGLDRNWFPLSNRTQIACGTFFDYHTYGGSWCSNEMDWNINLRLGPYFTHLGQSGNRIRPVLAEVTPDESFFANRWFPKDVTASMLLNQTICVHGPWVRDEDHENKREIHPAQLIWWQGDAPAPNVKSHVLLVVQDDSARFDENGDFDCSGLGDNLPPGFAPWARAPISGKFKIAFSIYPPSSQADQLSFRPMRVRIAEPARLRDTDVFRRYVVTSGTTESTDADDGTQHQLIYDGKRVVVVDEAQSEDTDIGVQFVDLRKRANGVVQGYVQLSTVVGRNGVADRGGYHVITADVEPAFNLSVPPPDLNVPDRCKPERMSLADLNRALAQVQESVRLLQASLGTSPPSHRPAIRQEIASLQATVRELRQQITRAERLLRRCESAPQ